MLPDARVHWQVWVVGELQDGKLKWRADSDSQLTKVSSCWLANPAIQSTGHAETLRPPAAVVGLSVCKPTSL